MGALCQLGKQPPPSLWSDLPAELAGLVLCGLPSHADRLYLLQSRLPPVAPRREAAVSTAAAGSAMAPLELGDLPKPPRRPSELLHFPGLFLASLHLRRLAMLCLRSTPTAKLFLTNPFTIQLILPDNYANSLGGFFAMAQLQKMIVCSDDLVAAIFHGGDVCYYRAGAPSWLVCTNDRREGHYYEDIAFHHGKLYAVTTREDLFAFDACSDSEVSIVEHAIKAVQPHPATNQGMLPLIKRYLVTSCGKLLMVKLIDHDVCFCRFVNGSEIIKRIEVKVFEAELTTDRWVEVKKLDDDQALFVSRGCSKAIPLSGHELGFQGNRVYFLSVELFSLFSEIKRADIPTCCFYDMTAGTNTAVFFKRGGDTRDLYTQEWFFPSM
ncbi:unnamed protein product [Urochloa decumbens]|uniref:KIB1-4 beta-propeller domain-containing protein n=1 Tax=Urochloa decumbens TaxID=240449 RepID=A0ABC9DFI5_9POAL